VQLGAVSESDAFSGDSDVHVGGAAGLLVDFDNLVPPQEPPNASQLRHRLLECLRLVFEKRDQVVYVRVRLYGGWMSNGLLSRRGSVVASILPLVDPFPFFRDDGIVIRGSLELAKGLLNVPGVSFDDTYRNRGSVPRLRLSDSPLPKDCLGALEGTSCPARILKQFTQSRTRVCPVAECAVTAQKAFIVHEQKMVDTLLSCDLLEMAGDTDYGIVSVVSADTDFVPSMLYAHEKTQTALQLQVPMAQWSSENTAILLNQGIDVVEMENLDGYR
jgi:hypothetical protein